MQHVPYKGSTPALADLLGGRLQFAGSSISSAASLLNAGKIRTLAVTSPRRNPALQHQGGAMNKQVSICAVGHPRAASVIPAQRASSPRS